MAFLDLNYLITNETGRELFEAIRDLPVVDPHNHANVKEIAENTNYKDAWQLFAATDHYVWEMLRKRNVPERLITGDAAPREKDIPLPAQDSCQGARYAFAAATKARNRGWALLGRDLNSG